MKAYADRVREFRCSRKPRVAVTDWFGPVATVDVGPPREVARSVRVASRTATADEYLAH